MYATGKHCESGFANSKVILMRDTSVNTSWQPVQAHFLFIAVEMDDQRITR
jgi:hypothetical protein